MDKLRFKDINGNNFPAWEEYSLDKVANVYQPQTISTNMFSTDGFPVYGANGIIGLYKNYNHENDQVLVSCRGENCGTVNLSSGKAWITGNTMVVNVDGNNAVDKKFLYYQLSNQNLRYLISGSGQPQIVGNVINKHLILLPKKQEQEKIGGFLSSFDKLIQKQKEKIGLLKELKKGYLQQMFPVKGSNIPKIRFKGFTEAWEQRNVSEITSFHKQGYYTTESYSDTKKYYLLRGTDFSQNSLILKDTPKIDASEKDYQAFKVEIGDFLIVRSGTVGTYGIVYDDIPAIFGSYLINFRFDQSIVMNEFFGLFYQSHLFRSQLSKIIQQSANTNINAENIKSTSIQLPLLQEQRKISIFLESIDKLITLHQHKLEKLEEMKKGYMQRLFI